VIEGLGGLVAAFLVEGSGRGDLVEGRRVA
jgi:hypothetical protein